ncbi:PfkB family carbohydrate kinase [Streptomyces sp. L7]
MRWTPGGRGLLAPSRRRATPSTEHVPLAVVTLGADGRLRRGPPYRRIRPRSSAIAVEALDPTGAGDVFVAGFVTGTPAGWRCSPTASPSPALTAAPLRPGVRRLPLRTGLVRDRRLVAQGPVRRGPGTRQP